jgi:polar amino acid transport system substrate-binding protein
VKSSLKWLTPLLLGVMLTAAACSSSDDNADYKLVADGKLTVCTDAPYEPFEFQDESGNWTGFDMDLLKEIATGLDLTLDVKVVPFDGIWLLPAAGECDIVGSAMTITEERAASTLFSDPYFDADQSLLVRRDEAEKFATLDSLKGEKIAVQTGTTGETYAQENKPEGSTLVSFDEPAAMFLALESGEVSAILQDLPVNGFRSTKDDAFVVTETFPTGEQYGFAVDPDNAGLIEVVNEELSGMRDDGSYDTTFTKWFG